MFLHVLEIQGTDEVTRARRISLNFFVGEYVPTFIDVSLLKRCTDYGHMKSKDGFHVETCPGRTIIGRCSSWRIRTNRLRLESSRSYKDDLPLFR